MARKEPNLLDSFAILRWTQREPGWERIKALLQSAEKGKEILFMSQINLWEVYYKSIRIIGLEDSKRFLETFLSFAIGIVHPSDEIIWKAAEIKADNPISLADCFAAATALTHRARIITGDPEFKKVNTLVEIEWL